MNDFETVRRFIVPNSGASGGSAVPNALAALDRIEAEVERLKALAKSYRRDWITAKAEVERLQAIIEANDNYDQDATEREVERLRAAATAVFMNPLDIDAMLKLGEVLGEVTPIHTDP